MTKPTATKVMETFSRSTQKALLLYVLNMGRPQQVPTSIAYEVDVRPEQFTPELQSRITDFVKLVRSTMMGFTPLDPVDFKVVIQRERLLQPINKVFASCITHPALRVSIEDGRTVSGTEHLSAGQNFVEAACLLAIRQLVDGGEFDLLRACEVQSCNRWFLAKREKQRWCSQTCRQRNHQATDEFREQRRRTYAAKKILAAAKKARRPDAKAAK